MPSLSVRPRFLFTPSPGLFRSELRGANPPNKLFGRLESLPFGGVDLIP